MYRAYSSVIIGHVTIGDNVTVMDSTVVKGNKMKKGSFQNFEWGWPGLNRRPPGYEPGALPS